MPALSWKRPRGARDNKIACIEKIAYRMGYIAELQMRKLEEPMRKNGYGQYLLQVLKGTM